MDAVFTDHSQDFLAKIDVFKDTFIGLQAAGIETKIKMSGRVPLLTKSTKYAQAGALRASIRHVRLSLGIYAVTAGVDSPAAAYAAAQEAGITRGHVMRNYSTPGTGPHWFKDAIEADKLKAKEYAAAAQKAAGIGTI